MNHVRISVDNPTAAPNHSELQEFQKIGERTLPKRANAAHGWAWPNIWRALRQWGGGGPFGYRGKKRYQIRGSDTEFDHVWPLITCSR